MKLLNYWNTQREFRSICKYYSLNTIEILDKILQKWIRKQKKKKRLCDVVNLKMNLTSAEINPNSSATASLMKEAQISETK